MGPSVTVTEYPKIKRTLHARSNDNHSNLEFAVMSDAFLAVRLKLANQSRIDNFILEIGYIIVALGCKLKREERILLTYIGCRLRVFIFHLDSFLYIENQRQSS